MKKLFSFILKISAFTLLTSCSNKTTTIVDEPREEKQEVNNNVETRVTEEDPLIISDKYHKGFEKRKISPLYPYKPLLFESLPILNISTNDGSNTFAVKYMTKQEKYYEPYTEVKVSLFNCLDEFNFNNVSAYIKQRGNTTSQADKKPFNLKFVQKQSMLGLNNGNKFKSWVLNALAFDSSSLRDRTALYLGKSIFNKNKLYTSDSTFVNLRINNVYWGLYLIQEKQQVNKNRVNIDDVEDRKPLGSYTGTDIGYFFEYDGFVPFEPYDETPSFRIDYHNDDFIVAYNKEKLKQYRDRSNNIEPMNYFSMKSEIYSNDQLNFISDYVDKVYDIIYEAIYKKRYYFFDETYTNLIERPESNSYEAINSVIDIQSFVDMFIFQDIVEDIDLGFSSKYMQVDCSAKGDKKLKWTALWDHDFCFGNDVEVEQYISSFYVGNGLPRPNAWLVNFVNEPWFMDKVKAKWKELIDHGVLYNSLHYIDEYRINYENNFVNDFRKWSYIWRNINRSSQAYKNLNNNFENSANYLFNWLVKRYNYMNKYFGDGSTLFTI